MIEKSEFTLAADGEVLRGTLVRASQPGLDLAADHGRYAAVIMHGGGTASQQRGLPLAQDLARRGHHAAAFDFSGHGGSSGRLSELSLRRRRDQARAVVDRILPTDRQLVLIGFSMSGQTVADLLVVYGERVSAIALCAPAVYDAAAWDVPFGGGFTELIRRPESWRETQALDILAAFGGRAVLVLPEQDAVIPDAVTRLVHEHLAGRAGAQYRALQLAGASHQLGLWLSEHAQDRASVLDALLGTH